MKVGIIGSREWPNLKLVADYVVRIADKYPEAVIYSGGARGVDNMAEEIARNMNLQVISYRPYEYENMYFKREFSIETIMFPAGSSDRRITPPFFPTFAGAAFCRNGWIVDDSDVVVAFQYRGSSGTADSIAKARAAGKLRDLVTA